MKCSPRPRKTAELSKLLHRQLNSYALAAGAAGVGLAALCQSAEAKIVYTPVHVKIGHGGAASYNINFDQNSDDALQIATFHNSCTDECLADLAALPSSGNAIEGTCAHSSSTCYAAALKPGAKIGPRAEFHNGREGGVLLGIFSLTTRKLYGHWNDVKDRYLGVKFNTQGRTHFGWVRLNVRDKGHTITALITGYAYETIPNKPIIAGETKGPDVVVQPGTLGSLALGKK